MTPLQHITTLLHDRLHALGEHPVTSQLQAIIASCDLTSARLRDALIDPGSHPYGRNKLFTTARWEALVMNWQAFRLCSPHDHGRSQGWVYVAHGSLKNRSYRWEPNGDLAPLAATHHAQGSLFHAPVGQIHEMQALTASLITVHFYTPPITGMRVFNLERCLSCKVADTCGAWWEEDQNLRFEELKFQLMHEQN